VATILDIRQLSELKIVTIDEKNQVTIAARTGSPLPLSPWESCKLQTFLFENDPRLTAACGGLPLNERILICSPDEAWPMLRETYQKIIWPGLKKRPGRASVCGVLVGHEERGFHYGGFSPDGKRCVFIPGTLYQLRYRELLMAGCREQLLKEAADNLYLLAATMDTEELLDDPVSEHPSLIVQAAREQALDVAYWLRFAGTMPEQHASLEARR
jgi:hypothetical protein